MNSDFRQRIFLPIILPLAVVIGFVGFAFALSRVLLAVPESASTTIAMGVATYVLLIAAIVTAKSRITSRALAVGVTLGVASIGVAGVVAGMAGMRPLEHDAEVAGEGDSGGGAESQNTGGEGEEGQGEAAPGTFVAVDIDFSAAPETLPAGGTTITIDNQGAAVHNVTFVGVNGEDPIVEAQGGQTDEGEVDLAPGSYTYYCSVPGHRPAMEGELTVE
jgi:plastocyanin